jgi:hypothetical protein
MPMNHDHRNNCDLRPADAPPRGAAWSVIERLARSFDGYGYNGPFEACAQIGNARRHETLADLRTRLLFERRRFNHSEPPPTTSPTTPCDREPSDLLALGVPGNTCLNLPCLHPLEKWNLPQFQTVQCSSV